PAARLVLGLGLGLAVGSVGAAWGAAVGGWLALFALHRAGRPSPDGEDQPTVVTSTGGTTLAFLGLAVLQHQDLVIANLVLDPADVGTFAALSTLGGLVAFATATLPLVLLPAARPTEMAAGHTPLDRASPGDDGSSATVVAVGAAVAVALASVVVAVLAADALVLAVVGPRYGSVAPLVPPYLAAMGCLGVARVVAARRCARGDGSSVARRVAGVAVAHALGVAALGRAPGQVVAVSAVALTATAGVLVLPSARPAHAVRSTWRARLVRWWHVPDTRLLVGLTIVAVLLRLATERSFWVDEAISVHQAQLPFGEMLHDLRSTDVHPPLHFVVLWLAVRVVGTAEWAVRLPSVLCGAALVPVLYGCARELYDRRTARVAAALVVPAPFLVWYSQEARMYALFIVVGVAAVWAQVAALRKGDSRAFAAWAVTSAALLWTQWFALLPLAAQQLATVVHLVRRRRSDDGGPPLLGRWVGSLALTGILVLPLVPFLADQLAAYGERGAGLAMPAAAGADSSDVASGLSSYAVIANLAWALGGYHSDDVMVRLGALWPLAVLGCLLLLGRRLEWSTKIVAAVALLPAAALFVIAHSKRDLFELRYFVLAAPLLLVLVARAVTTLAHRRATLGVAMAGLLALSGVALADQQVNGTNPRLFDFRGAVEEIDETSQPGDVLAYAPGYLDGVLGYYAPDLRGMPLASIDGAEVDGQVYVVVAERFLTADGSGRVGDALARLEQARGTPERFERPNVIVWRFR
ncbi:MAG: glycosyltransferase family 39 protein, partial [Acidimicrobiales bacterium]